MNTVGQGGLAEPGAELTFRRFLELAASTTIPRIAMYTSYPGAERLKQYPPPFRLRRHQGSARAHRRERRSMADSRAPTAWDPGGL